MSGSLGPTQKKDQIKLTDSIEVDFVNQLANSFSPLLLKLADDPNVIIAKMDATANDVPSPYEVSG